MNAGRGRMPGSTASFLCAACFIAAASTPARAALAAQDPSRTATIYVHGFELTGADRHGVFGDDIQSAVAESVAALGGATTAISASGPLPANVVAGTTYYGDQAPSYYSAADRAALDRITAEWGGGVPRYAFIVARHAQRILERSGARQLSFVSGSFGSLVVRWLIEKNVCGLAGDGRIARWLSVEGVVAGNWVASNQNLVQILSTVLPEPIDVRHMDYGWIEANLHAPRTEGACPYYAGILLGQVASTDDGGPGTPLRDAMLYDHEYQPNDGVQGLRDACFQTMAREACYAGMPPTHALFQTQHLGIQTERAAWAEAVTFLTATHRVTVTMTGARVTNLHERVLPFWSQAPAEVLFEARVFSPAVAARWGITGPVSAQVKEGAAIPLELYARAGDAKSFRHVLFDDMVLPEETQLTLDLHAVEVDYDPRYGVFETVQPPYYDDMGGGTLVVSTREPGSYRFAAGDWSCTVEVAVFDYPASAPVRVADLPAGPVDGGALVITPNPSRSGVKIVAPVAGRGAEGTATLEVMDISGRMVRRLPGAVRDGFAWDGRDQSGHPLKTGVYFYRLTTPQRTWLGRSAILR